MDFHVDADGRAVLVLTGSLDVTSAPGVRDGVLALCSRTSTPVTSLEIDASRLDHADFSGMAVLHELTRGGSCAGVSARLQGLRPEFQGLLDAFPDERACGGPPAERQPFRRLLPAMVGARAVQALRSARAQVEFLGAIVEALRARERRGAIRWSEVGRVFVRGGVDALPIVLLVSFLTGLVIAFESVGPFSRYGARILIADTIGLAMTRELGPLMTAVIISGRSGSAFAAELGTMKVNEELDALSTMGLDPVRFLVLQRLLAAVLLSPLLTAYAMASGVLGGYVVMWSLGLSTSMISAEMVSAVGASDLLFGLAKGSVFGAAIALVGCQRGVRAGQGPTAVGNAATSAVVSSIVLITVIDCLFAFLRNLVGS